MTSKRTMIFSRVDPDLRDRVRDGADQRFQGNESMLVRDAVTLYLDILDTQGPRFDLVVAGLRQPVEPQEQAA